MKEKSEILIWFGSEYTFINSSSLMAYRSPDPDYSRLQELQF